MSWLESQIETRARLDTELTERAYAELAMSVSGRDAVPAITVDDIEQTDGAIRTCLKYIGVEAGQVPDGATDEEQRIEWLCRPSGTMYRAVRLDQGWYKQAFGAMLGHLDTGTAIALLPQGTRGYYYLEPGSGRKVKVNAESAKRIAEDAILFYKPLPMKSLKLRDLAAFVLRSFNRADYQLVIIAALAAALIGLLPAWANQVAFGVVAPSGQARLILPIAALLVGVTVSSAIIGICRGLVMARISTKLDVTTAAATFARVLALPPSFFKEYPSGNLASRLGNTTRLAQTIASLLLGTGLTAVLALVYVVQIGAYTPSLALPALCVVLIEAVLTVLVTYANVGFEREMMQANAKLSGLVTALLNGIQKIKLAGAEERSFAKWAHGYAAYARAAYNRPAILRALPALVALVGLLGNILIYYLVGTSDITYDYYMAFNVAFGQATGAIMGLAESAGQFAQIRPMSESAAPILEATPEVAADRPPVTSLTGGIEVSGVSFRYSEDSPFVLWDLSFKVEPGEYVALVGKSGCGKSTIMRIMLGFEKPERGTVFYGPHDVQKVDLRSLRRHIGVVMQDGRLFMGNIASNITISAPTATLDDAWEAAEIAGVADDIRKMPMGMQTFVSEGGGGISGGQRQRLMIARAVCGKRKILMLDEATSALDNMTQKHVSDSLETLKCTRIVIAHRLSTVRHCDRILVVDDGRIAEEGTYEELIAKNGLFAELVERPQLDAKV